MFLHRPRPFADESLSSWRQRLGFANGFWRFPSPTGRRSGADPDRLPNIEEQNWLARECGIDYSSLASLCLETTLTAFQSKNLFSPRLRWLLPIGEKKTPATSGPMFCPICLKEDPSPYFRAYWRYAFLTDCPHHGVPLLDSCPGCSSPIWPAALPLLSTRRPWTSNYTCPHCSFDLRYSQGGAAIVHSSSVLIWDALLKGSPPIKYPHTETLPYFFDGLWVLSQLLLRSGGSKLLSYLTCEGITSELRLAKITQVEGLPVRHRREILAGALWLMDDWPSRFLTIANDTRLTKSAFIPTAAFTPPWLSVIVEEHLAVRRTTITSKDVSQAIESLEAEGRTVTKSAVRRQLGVSESIAINERLSRRELATVEELLAFVNRFELQLDITADARDQRATLIRDYLIFLLSVLQQLSINALCKLSLDEVTLLLDNYNQPAYKGADVVQQIRGRAKALSVIYLAYARPRLIKGQEDPGNYFVGRQGEPFAGHTLRERIAGMMSETLPNDLWNSCDVFINTLQNVSLNCAQ